MSIPEAGTLDPILGSLQFQVILLEPQALNLGSNWLSFPLPDCQKSLEMIHLGALCLVYSLSTTCTRLLWANI